MRRREARPARDVRPVCWGKRTSRRQSLVQQPGGLVEFNGQVAFQSDIASLRAVEAVQQIGQIRYQNLPQPGHQLGFGRAAKLSKIAMRFKKRLLNEVRRVRLSLQTPIDLQAGQQGQVAAVHLQERAERRILPARQVHEVCLASTRR